MSLSETTSMRGHFHGGPLDGEVQDAIRFAREQHVPQYEGRKLVGWEDGPIYSYPEHVYTLTRWEGHDDHVDFHYDYTELRPA